jgi:hypothetical protein
MWIFRSRPARTPTEETPIGQDSVGGNEDHAGLVQSGLMNISLSLTVAAVISLSVAEPSGVRNSQQVQNEQILIQRIKEGDVSAIAEAGRSGDRYFIPYLRHELEHRRNRPDIESSSRVALAKLGETDQLQEEWCKSISEDPDMGPEAPILELGSIGGWFAVQGLTRFFTPEGQVHWNKAVAKFSSEHPDDRDVMLAAGPAQYALRVLPTIVPDPPLMPTTSDAKSHSEEQIRIWQDWIAAHRDKLSKLQPIGNGVDFSDKACKNGKPVKKR